MAKVQYRILRWSDSLHTVVSPAIEEELNKWAALGWELTQFVNDGKGQVICVMVKKV